MSGKKVKQIPPKKNLSSLVSVMKMGGDLLKWFLIIPLTLILRRVNSVPSVCELSFTDHDRRINYSLATPLAMFPHGVLSEDGFYKVAMNETVLWFQLCGEMLFNHDPPRCVDCLNCRGPSCCGSECSALVANNIGGYDACTAIGLVSHTNIKVMDNKNPHTGVIVSMSTIGQKHNCSLSVTVICNQDGVQGPQSTKKLGTCDYATMLRHPAGCATVVSVAGRGLGWFGTFITIILCLFGSYLLAGTVYRCFVLGVHGVNAIPNLDTWVSLPHRTQSFFSSLVWRFRGPSEGNRSSYFVPTFEQITSLLLM